MSDLPLDVQRLIFQQVTDMKTILNCKAIDRDSRKWILANIYLFRLVERYIEEKILEETLVSRSKEYCFGYELVSLYRYTPQVHVYNLLGKSIERPSIYFKDSEYSRFYEYLEDPFVHSDLDPAYYIYRHGDYLATYLNRLLEAERVNGGRIDSLESYLQKVEGYQVINARYVVVLEDPVRDNSGCPRYIDVVAVDNYREMLQGIVDSKARLGISGRYVAAVFDRGISLEYNRSI